MKFISSMAARTGQEYNNRRTEGYDKVQTRH